ncbi:hypothetical protein [Jidongwangia harbinensis]|uniref:hypothetical protein n=1 Tax=Jidongwangia harbinensis TaxID=2878561 RepID=UPI001CDA2957|nr:hypothetical protein [Jidongwangia harbinensis]MCA2219113.1 hypothetical protein [Jidongwangia harbinensis]
MPDTTTTATGTDRTYLYEYFYSYTANFNGGQTFGNGTVTRRAPITSMDDIATITREIAAHFHVADPLVLSYSLLRRSPLERP